MSKAAELIKGILAGERRSLAKAITAIESSRTEDVYLSEEILNAVSSNEFKSIRIGISGVPGAGKSTFIEAFGMYVISLGHKVAVLAVDPTSPISGGSILGDKTRMAELAQSDLAFIRPSPTGGNLGGVARKTKDAITLCEAAGYDVIIVETVGVGQSEIAVADMTDIFLLLLLANAGDELQGIKKGIMEMADIVIINKADGSNKVAAELARKEFQNAINLFKHKLDYWNAPVLTISSLQKIGIDTIWDQVIHFKEVSGKHITKKREEQNEKWLWTYVQDRISRELQSLKENDINVKETEKNFKESKISLRKAVEQILGEYKKL